MLTIWDLESETVQVLELENQRVRWLHFDGQDRLYSAGWKGLRKWNLHDGTSDLLVPDVTGRLSPDGRYFLAMTLVEGSYPPHGRSLSIYDLEKGINWTLPSHGNEIVMVGWHPSGNAVITSGMDGILRVSTPQDERTYLLYGHVGGFGLWMDPAGKWIASAGMDQTVRLWPMPDISKPPFHTLPYVELMSRLKSMTNYRIVQDESSSTGYRVDFGPFLGWAHVPEW